MTATHRTRRTRLTLVLALPLLISGAASFIGCDSEKKITTPPVISDYLPQSSVANVLANFRTAYTKRNIVEYRKLFATDYTFVFAPADATDPDNPTPMSWGLAEEFLATGNMFTDTQVEKIELEYGSLGTPERADTLVYGTRTWKSRVDGVNLAVRTRNQQGEPLTYLVPGTTEVFYFREDPTHRASDGRSTWYITRWEDQPIGALKTERTSWGQIKTLYK